MSPPNQSVHDNITLLFMFYKWSHVTFLCTTFYLHRFRIIKAHFVWFVMLNSILWTGMLFFKEFFWSFCEVQMSAKKTMKGMSSSLSQHQFSIHCLCSILQKQYFFTVLGHTSQSISWLFSGVIIVETVEELFVILAVTRELFYLKNLTILSGNFMQ